MADYRDELRAAHERIAQLESRQPPQPPPPEKDHTGLVVAAIFVGAGLLVGGGLLTMARVRPRAYAPPPAEVAIPVANVVAPALGMTWYPQALVAPSFVDIDEPADGKNEVIGLAWKAGNDEAALHVVAFDRATLVVRWNAGPYPAHWSSDRVHLVVAKDRIIVTDSRSKLHFLDVHTGVEVLLPTAFEDGAQYVCPVRDGTARALLNHGYNDDTTMVVDATTGAIAKAPKGIRVRADEPLGSRMRRGSDRRAVRATRRQEHRRQGQRSPWNQGLLVDRGARRERGPGRDRLQRRWAQDRRNRHRSRPEDEEYLVGVAARARRR